MKTLTKLSMFLAAMVFALGTFNSVKANGDPPVFTGNGVFQRVTTQAQLSEGWFVIANSAGGSGTYPGGTMGTAQFAMSNNLLAPSGATLYGFEPIATATLDVDPVTRITDPPANVVWHIQHVEGNFYRIRAFDPPAAEQYFIHLVSNGNLGFIETPTAASEWSFTWTNGFGGSFEVLNRNTTAQRFTYATDNDPNRFVARGVGFLASRHSFQLFKWDPDFVPPAGTVTAESSNTAHGTVALNGNVITATPAPCYGFADPVYTISPADAATVVRNNNVFTVNNITEDVTVTINFAYANLPHYTVTLNLGSGTYGGSLTLTQETCVSPVILPAPTPIQGWQFAGWRTSAVSQTTTNPLHIFPAGEFVPTGDMTLYAVYVQPTGSQWRAVLSNAEIANFTPTTTPGSYLARTIPSASGNWTGTLVINTPAGAPNSIQIRNNPSAAQVGNGEGLRSPTFTYGAVAVGVFLEQVAGTRRVLIMEYDRSEAITNTTTGDYGMATLTLAEGGAVQPAWTALPDAPTDFRIFGSGGAIFVREVHVYFPATFNSNPIHEIIATPDHLAFGTVEVGDYSDAENITVSGVNLVGNITHTLSDTDNFRLVTTGWTPATGGTLGVVFEPSTSLTPPAGGQLIQATLTLSAEGAQNVVIDLSGTAVLAGSPIVRFASHTPLEFAETLVEGATPAQTTPVISGENLNDNAITFHLASGANFTVANEANFTATGGTLGITFTPTVAGLVRDTLVIQSIVGGTTAQDSLPLLGTGVALIGAPPTALAATNVTSSGFTANWTAVDNATSYQVRIYQGATTGTLVTTRTVDAPATSLEITGTGISDNTEFTFTVVARGELNQSTEASNPIQVTTPPAEVPIARWVFRDIATAGFGPSPFAPEAHNINVTVGGLTRHWSPSGGTPAGHGWGGNNFATATTAEAAIAANNFATFTLTANALHALSVSEIGNYNIRRSQFGPSTGQWQFQIGTGAFVDIGTPITWGTVTTAEGNPQAAIDLSGITELQSVAEGTVVTFRLVLWGATNAGGTFYFNDAAGSAANRPGLSIFGELVSTAAVATPVFSAPAGNMFATTDVTITVPGGGAEIFYSKDPTAPREEFSALPASGYVTITETTTLRAFGRIGGDESVMAQAIYTFPVDVATVAEFLAQSYAAPTTMFRITGDLTFVWRPASDQGTVAVRDNVFLKDETGGLLVFDNEVPRVITAAYAPGDLITGGLVGTRDMTWGQVRLATTPHQPELSAPGVPSPLSVEPVEITMADLLADIDNMNARLVRIVGVNFATEHTFIATGTGEVAATNVVFTQGQNEMTARSHFHGIGMTVNTTDRYDLTGFVWRDVRGTPPNTTRQLVLRNAADIVVNTEPVITADLATVTFGTQYVNTTSAATAVTVTGAHLTNYIYGELAGGAAAHFDAINADGWDIETGGTINITFRPTTAGPKSAVLNLRDGSDGAILRTITLLGVGVDDPATSICPRDIEERTVVLFPNPVVDVLMIQAEQAIATVRIYNLAGQLVAHGNRNYVDMSTLPRGTYVVRIVFEDGAILTRTVVK